MGNLRVGHFMLITVVATLMLTVYSMLAADLNQRYGVSYVDPTFNDTLASISNITNKTEFLRAQIEGGENTGFFTTLFNAGGVVIGLVSHTFLFVYTGLLNMAILLNIPIGIMLLVITMAIITISLLVMGIIFKWDVI